MVTTINRPAPIVTGAKSVTLNLGPAMINVTHDLFKNLVTGSIQAESNYILLHSSGSTSVRTAPPRDHGIVDEKINSAAVFIARKLSEFVKGLPEGNVAKQLSFEALNGRVIAKASSEAVLRHALPHLKDELEIANHQDKLVFDIPADSPMKQLAHLSGIGASR